MAEEYILTRPVPLSIDAEDVDRLIALGSGDAALLYLYILRSGGKRCDEETAARVLHLSSSLAACEAQLRSIGLIRGAAPAAAAPPERTELPEPTAAEARQTAEADGSFRGLLSETSLRLGRVLSTADLKILFGIYHDLGLPADVILLLEQACIDEVRQRFGAGRVPTMKQIEKEAYIWHNRGIFTAELAERHLRRRAERRGEVLELCRMLGIRDRALAPSEEKTMLGWLDMGFGKEAILLAYDRTIRKKGELALPYMNRILESWHEKGLHTVAEVEAGDRPPEKKKPPAAADAGPGAAEYDRMREYMNRLNGGGDHGT